MKRRTFLTTLGLAGIGIGLSGYRWWPDEGFWNPCRNDALPEHLLDYELVQQALEGIDFTQLWDCHAHLVGVGDNSSGIWINPNMRSIWNPIQNVQFLFYLNASCANIENNVDHTYVERLKKIVNEFPQGTKTMLLAFDYHHDEAGQRVNAQSPFHTPNEYTKKIAKEFPERFEWVASVHPYREDAVDILKDAISNNARAVKWLPQAMNIDPSSDKCDAFYQVLAEKNIPLISHAGDEHAVDAGELQKLGNPLLLRRPLDAGVKVIVAHCASVGSNTDLDKGSNAEEIPNIELFSRLMGEEKYQSQLYGDISAVTQINRSQSALETIYIHDEWHDRLVYGSDYPLPGVMPVFSPQTSVDRGYISSNQAQILSEIRTYNPLMFDVLYKRMIRIQGKKLSNSAFHTRSVFDKDLVS